MRIGRILLSMLLALALLALGGCAFGKPKVSPSSAILGTWHDSRTGAQYRFLPDGVLVVPSPQPGEGNAVAFKLLGDGSLDVSTGGTHRVSLISTLTAGELVLIDPVTGRAQPLLRDPAKTAYASSLGRSAIAHLGDAQLMSADTTITWVARRPSGKGSEWTNWETSTIDTYIQSWDWTGLKRAAAPISVAGSGPLMGYSFPVLRTVSSDETLAATWTNDSTEATAGLPIIDVGYSPAKADYPAGALVYLPAGLIYSLGDGYAIAVGRDDKASAFVPLTHN
jgi:hypothetical protein